MRMSEYLYDFAQAVVAAERVEMLFDAAMATIEAALTAKRSAILTFDSEGAMRFRSWRNLSDAYRASVEGHSPWSHDTVAPEPIAVPDVNNDLALSSYVPVFASEGIGALAFIPLVSGGRLLGKVVVYYDGPHTFASHDIETARAIANHLATAIARFAAIAKLEDTIRYNEIFAGVLAHDLRNPLGAMMSAAQLALMHREGEAERAAKDTKPLSRIISSGQRMTTMIDQSSSGRVGSRRCWPR
jgi:GAF domain-containing protein